MSANPSLLDLRLCAWRTGILMPECLPLVASELLAEGVDSPALPTLAGIDLSPFDPRDASDLLEEVITELSMPEPPIPRRLEMASALLSFQLLSGAIRPRRATRRFAWLAVSEAYPSEPPELMDFYVLDDEWDIRVVALEQVEREVKSKASELLNRLGLASWKPPPVIRKALPTEE